MNRPIKLLLTSILLISSSVVLAQGPNARMAGSGAYKPGDMHGIPAAHHLVRVLHHLDLSEEQRENIEAVVENLKSEIEPVLVEMHEGKEQLKELIKADAYDEAAVATLAELEGELTSERIRITSRAMSDVYAYLTVEQREQLDEIADRHKRHRDRTHRHLSGEG